ncbi:lipopolysaccharide biosynthesis protein [Sphingobacterium corticis]|uniref:Lipopolysaccharide biosynthesis protein n=1 Tax=Sphingobacterium corticis TaxID=1812823 RepID=A0ABW5NG54_9SPHI
MDQNISAQEESLKKKAAKGFLWGGLSNGLQQVFGLIFGIVLLRTLSPEDYGLVGILTIFSSIASSLTESGFVSAISIKKDVTKADYNAVFWFCIFLGAFIYMLLFLLSPVIADFYEIPALALLAQVSFLNFFISSFGVAHSANLTRNLRIKERANANIVAVFVGGILAIAVAFAGWGYWALVVQNLSYCLVYVLLSWRYSSFRPSFQINLAPVKPMLAYSNKLIITNVFFHLNNNFLSAVLGKYVPIAQVGQYNSANRWNLTVQSFTLSISNMIIQPLMTEASQSGEERRIRVFRKLLSFISFITFPSMFGLALIAPDFVLLAGGGEWAESGNYLRILAFGGAFAIVSNAFSNYTLSKGKSDTYMKNMVAFGLIQIALFFLLKEAGVTYIVMSFAVLNFIWLNTWYFLSKESLQYSYRYLWKDVYAYALIALAGYLMTFWWINMLPSALLRLSLSVLSMGAVYIVLTYFFNKETFLEIKKFFQNKL